MANERTWGGTTTLMLDAKYLRDPAVLTASGFGLGFLPRAPGTWGSAAALLVWWLALVHLSVFWQVAICVACFGVGWWCSAIVCRRFAVDDAPQIVVDEVVGMWLTLIMLPSTWWLSLLAFVMFRWLDIVKPGPIGWLDREVKGGLGVMVDDVAAGLVAGIVLYLSVWSLTAAGFTQLIR